MTGLRPQLESKFSDVHSHRAPSWKITCRTVQVLPECLRLSTRPAVHCIVASQGVQLKNPEQTPLTHRVGQLDTTDSEKETPDPCAQALLLTGAPGCPTESATGSRQCNSLQCSLVHGSGRLNPTPLTEQDRRVPEGQGNRTAKTNKRDKRIQGQTNLRTDSSREGREEVTGVCVCDVGAGGPLQSLVTSVS